MRRSASEILRNLESRIARLEKQSSKIKETPWKLEDTFMGETWKKEFKDSAGRVTSYLLLKQYEKTRTPRGTGWALQFSDFGHSVAQGRYLIYGDNSILTTTDLYWERSDKMF